MSVARRDEEFAKLAFDRAFTSRIGSALAWSRGSNPPDFEARHDSVCFAVEVTTICEQVNLRGRRVSANTLHAGLGRFVDDLRAEVLQAGDIPGTYILSLDGGPLSRDQIDSAHRAALDYIERTASENSAVEEVILRVGPLEWTIEKHHVEEPLIEAITCSNVDGAWGAQIREEFPKLLSKAVAEKTHKLRAIDLPKVLLLIDDYHYAEERLWHSALPQSSLEVFHTIARVHGAHECNVLASKLKQFESPG